MSQVIRIDSKTVEVDGVKFTRVKQTREEMLQTLVDRVVKKVGGKFAPNLKATVSGRYIQLALPSANAAWTFAAWDAARELVSRLDIATRGSAFPVHRGQDGHRTVTVSVSSWADVEAALAV